MRTCLILVISLFIVSCEKSTVTKGILIGRNYINQSVGVQLELPEGWSVILEEHSLGLDPHYQMIAENQQLDKWLTLKAKTLVSSYKYQDKDFDIKTDIMVNPNISVYVEELSNNSGIDNAYQYIPYFKKALKQHRNIEYLFSNERTRQLGQVKVEEIEYSFEVIGVKVFKRSFLIYKNPYLINISIAWPENDNESLRLLMNSFSSISLKEYGK